MRVPPAYIAAAGTRVRGALGRAEQRMAPPFQFVLERLFGLLDTKALFCAVELRIPDLLAAGEKTADALAAQTHADADAVFRLLRYLVSRGFFTSTGERTFSNGPTTEILRVDHPFSCRAWVQFFGSDWNAEIWNHLPERLLGATSAVNAAFGVPFFEYINDVNPDAGGAFNAAMAIGSTIQAAIFSENIDLKGVSTLCDVGGGTGAVAAHLMRVHLNLHATILDLPSLEEEAKRTLTDADVDARGRFIAGDFFDAIPSGHDLYTLFAVLHDWDDHSVIRILQNIRASMPQDARVMVIEKPIASADRADFAKASDLLMLALSEGGRERTEGEYKNLFRAAGFEIRRRTLLPSLFCVFDLVPPN